MLARILIVILICFISEVKAQRYPYAMQADVTLLLGEGVLPVPGGQVFNGIRVNKWSMETGIAVGADIYRQFNVLPLLASLKWMPLPAGAFRPYASLNAGYGFSWLNQETAGRSYRGGTVFNPSIGLRIKTKSVANLSLSAGYKQQKASISQRDTDDLGRTVSEATERYKFSRISLGFGVGL